MAYRIFSITNIRILCFCFFILNSPYTKASKSCLDLVSEFVNKPSENILRNYTKAPDFFTKNRILDFLKRSDEDRDMMLRLIYKQGKKNTTSQEDTFLKYIGLGPYEIQYLRDKKFFDFNIAEFERLTTLPPMNRAHVVQGAKVSILNQKGNLENATVVKIDNDNIHVSIHSQEDHRQQIVSKRNLYRPLEEGTELFYFYGEAISEIRRIYQQRIINETMPSQMTKVTYIDDSGRVKLANFREVLTMDQLRLRPRRAIKTSEKDLSESVKEHLKLIRKAITKLIETYKYEGESRDFIELNNIIIKSIQTVMGLQGISTSIVPSRHEGTLNLVLNGVHQNGNKIAQLYMKMAQQQNVQRLMFSLARTSKVNIPFIRKAKLGMIIDYNVILDMLEKKKNEKMIAVFRQQMFREREKMGRYSIFSHHFSAHNATKDIYGFNIIHQESLKANPSHLHLNFERIYIDSLSIVNGLEGIRHNTPVQQFIQISKAESQLEELITLTNSIKTIVDDILKISPNLHVILKESPVTDGTLDLADSFNRKISIKLSEKLSNIFDRKRNYYLLDSLSEENIAKLKRRFGRSHPDVQQLFSPHIKFMERRPDFKELQAYRTKIVKMGQKEWTLEHVIDEAELIKRESMVDILEENTVSILRKISLMAGKILESAHKGQESAYLLKEQLLLDSKSEKNLEELIKNIGQLRRLLVQEIK